jgi:hypothetical protein
VAEIDPASLAGITLADGRRVFVAGAPADLPFAGAVEVLLDGVAVSGRVQMPPGLVIWCDPEVPLAALLAVGVPPAVAAPPPAPQPLALFLAADASPDDPALRAMLALAAGQSNDGAGD